MKLDLFYLHMTLLPLNYLEDVVLYVIWTYTLSSVLTVHEFLSLAVHLFIVLFDAGVTISFVLAGTSCVLNGLCYAELASRFPAVSGGAYLYTYTAFNELTAFLVFAQLMLDYHIGAASIARSLASYMVTMLELFPFFKDNVPSWIGHGGEEFLGANLSINMLAPIVLAVLTVILSQGVKESSALNSIMTATKVLLAPPNSVPKELFMQRSNRRT